MDKHADLNNWTKVDLARFILQVLRNQDHPPAADHGEVQHIVRRTKKIHLVERAEQAFSIQARRAKLTAHRA